MKAKNKTQAVLSVIEAKIKRKKFERIKEMAGKMKFNIETEELRDKDERLGVGEKEKRKEIVKAIQI